MEWIRLVVGVVFIAIGLIIFAMEVFGIFRFDYALNRMHVAAMGDTMAMGSSLIGLVLFCGLNFATFKIIMIVIFFWITSPVCSHMLSKLEVTTNENLEEHCAVRRELSEIERELEEEQDAKGGK